MQGQIFVTVYEIYITAADRISYKLNITLNTTGQHFEKVFVVSFVIILRLLIDEALVAFSDSLSAMFFTH